MTGPERGRAVRCVASLIDFSHGQEKDIAQKEECQQEKTNPEKISNQEKIGGEEEAGEESCAEKACCEKEAGDKEEIDCEKETCREESYAPARGNHQPSYSYWTSRTGRSVRRAIRRYARAFTQKL